jgi:hypothetical protein
MRQHRPEGPFVDRAESDLADSSVLACEEPRLALVSEAAPLALLGAGRAPDAEMESEDEDVEVVDEEDEDEDEDEDEEDEDEEKE